MDTVQSYRRTFLGPFWITLNMVVLTTAMIFVYGALFAQQTKEYAAYLVCGMIAWFWISALITEVGNTFLVYAHFIKSTPIDKSQFIWATVYKQILILGHHLIVYAALVAFGVIQLTPYTVLVIPAVATIFLMSIPITAITAILFVRFRDLPRLLGSVAVVLLMITPIFWQAEMISGWRSAFVYLNPVYYVVEFIRRPLLGTPLDPIVAIVVIVSTVLLWIGGGIFYRRYEKYVVFWI